MRWTWLQPRFGLRTLLAVVLVSALAIAWWTSAGRWRSYNNLRARQRIDPYELKIAGDGDRYNVPTELVAILGDSRLRHWGPVHGATILTGNKLVSGGPDGKLRIWDTRTGRQVFATDATGMEASGNRRFVFFAEADGKIKYWDADKSEIVGTLPGKSNYGRFNLAVNLDGSVLVAEGSQEGGAREITAWDVPNSREICSVHPTAPGGGALAVSSDGQYFTWEENQQVQVSETQTGKVEQRVGPVTEARDKTGSRCMLGKVVFSPDDSKLYVGSANVSIVVFDRASGEELERIGPGRNGLHQFALDRELQLAIPCENQVRLFGRGMGEWSHTIDFSSGRRSVSSVDVQGTLLAATHREDGVSLWSGNLPTTPLRINGGPPNSARCLAFGPVGTWLATGTEQGDLMLWEVGTWKLLRKWRGHSSAILSLSVAANGSKMASAAQDGIAVWNPDTGAEFCSLRNLRYPEYLALSPDGDKLATNTDRILSKEFEIWDAEKGTSLAKIGPLTTSMFGPPAWSPDGMRVTCNDMNAAVYAFDVTSNTLISPLGKTRYGQCAVRSVWMSDNKRLVTAGWGRDEVHWLEVGKAAPLLTINAGKGRVRWVDLHPSEEWIVLCGEGVPVQIWQLATRTLVKEWQIGPAKGVVSQVAFSPDGHYLATVNGNGTAYVLNLDGVLP